MRYRFADADAAAKAVARLHDNQVIAVSLGGGLVSTHCNAALMFENFGVLPVAPAEESNGA